MPRKRLTQIFPWLLPLRKKQRLFCFYTGMHLDKNHYAKTKSASILPNKMFETSCPLFNCSTGLDMIYQINKVFNLKLAAAKLDTVLIKPQETFSFWQLVRFADKQAAYKQGLIVKNGKLVTTAGGGICQMSNLLFWLFLHTPLTITERHTHAIKDFPTPYSDMPEGVDATVSEGWLDLKVKNETAFTFQIRIAFDEKNIIGSIFTDSVIPYHYEIEGKDLRYFRIDHKIFEEIAIYRNQISPADIKNISAQLLYINLCEIGYALPAEIPIIEKIKKVGRGDTND